MYKTNILKKIRYDSNITTFLTHNNKKSFLIANHYLKSTYSHIKKK